MEVMQATAKMQQSHMASPKSSSPEVSKGQMVQVKTEMQSVADNQSADIPSKPSKMEHQQNVEDLVSKLNRSLNPFNTSLRFGFDNSSEDFYVSVIDTKTNHMIRRFPVEEAQYLLPKMQEINGMLFDQTA